MLRYAFHAMRMNLRRAAQYRASFIMQCIAQAVMTAGDLLAVLFLLERFTRMGHWEPPELLFFFGVMQLTFSFTEIINRGLGRFSNLVSRGDLDTILLRPRSPLLQVILSEIDPRRVGSMLIGLLALVLAQRSLQLSWTLPNMLLLIWSMTGTAALLMGLFLIEASMCFFTIQGLEIVNVLTYGGRQVCQYPVDLFPGPLRTLFLYVAPIALCMHLPLSFLLGHPMVSWPAVGYWLAPLAGFAFFGLITLFWRFGLRRYRSSGS